MANLDILKVMKGSDFQGFTISLKLISDLDLGGLDDLRSDLLGHLRLPEAENVIFQ